MKRKGQAEEKKAGSKKKKEEESEEEEMKNDDDIQEDDDYDEEEAEEQDESDDDDDSEDDKEEDSEDDIKMYGSGQEDEEDEEDEEEVEEEMEGKGKAKKGSRGQQPKAGAGASAGKQKTSKRKGDKADKEMDVSFDFSDPDDKFLFGIRALLQWLSTEGVDISSLAELIIQEKGLGSIIHCRDETDVFALATTLNADYHKDNAGMTTLNALLQRRCPPSLAPQLKRLLADPQTYLFLHARFVNLPLPLIPLLHQSAKDDMMWAQKQDKELPKIKHLITISPCTVDFGSSNSSNTAAKGGGGKEKKGKSGAASAGAAKSSSSSSSSLPYAPNDAIYDRFEDELFAQEAEMCYCFRQTPVAATATEGGVDSSSTSKKKGGTKRKEGVSSNGNAAATGGSSGFVVSLIDDQALSRILPKIEEMLG